MSIYQSDPLQAPDRQFEPGVLGHLVVGNRARLLDPRRTPMTIVAVRPDVGFCTMRVDGFEDAGATWDIPFEEMATTSSHAEAAEPLSLTRTRSARRSLGTTVGSRSHATCASGPRPSCVFEIASAKPPNG